MRLYVAGPMSGLPGYNYAAFDAAEKRLTALGFDVVNPARHGFVDGWEWLDYMRCGITDVASVDGVAVLPGWEMSRGAFLEVTVARGLGLPVCPEADWSPADLKRGAA